MGSYEIYPNMYIIFVAPPGVARKSTTAGYAEEILLDVNDKLQSESINIAPTATSAQKLIETLSNTDDASLTIISSEFSSFIGTTSAAMYELLTDIFDGKRKYDRSTYSHNIQLSERPVVNLLAATTPSWIAKQPPEHFIGGGFTSRVILIFESNRRAYKMYYDDVDYDKIDKLQLVIANDLDHIATTLNGEFKHENKELRDMMEQWYQDHAKKGSVDPATSGYHERKHLYVHKIAMCLSACERDDLIITKQHFEASQKLLESIEEKMPRALSQIGSNPLGHYMYDIRDFILERGEVTKKQVARRFSNNLDMEQLSAALHSLAFTDDIEVTKNENDSANPSYKAKKK